MVSIIVPFYNTGKYLDVCIRSLSGQTFSDIEILMVNDGSTDSSLDVCKAHARRDKRIRTIDGEHKGVSHAVKAGVLAAQGETIMFVDSDDWVEADYVEVMLKEMILYDVDLVVTSFVREGIKYRRYMRLSCLPDGYYRMDTERDAVLSTLVSGKKTKPTSIEASRSGKIFKAALLRKNLDFIREDIEHGEDAVLVLAYALDCVSVYIHADAYLYHYRERPGSITTTYRPDLYKRYEILHKHMEKICAAKSRYDFAPQFRLKRYHMMKHCIRIIVKDTRPDRCVCRVRAVKRICAYYNRKYNFFPSKQDVGIKIIYHGPFNFCVRNNFVAGLYMLVYSKGVLRLIFRLALKHFNKPGPSAKYRHLTQNNNSECKNKGQLNG